MNCSTVSTTPEISERRQGPDRRRRPTPMIAAFTTAGRRRGFRRAGESLNTYLDRPRPRVVAWALSLMAFSAFDALLTIIHLQAGGRELIPTMRLLLTYGDTTFVLSKMSTTGIAVWFLALHQNFPLARMAYRVLFLAYSALMGYHLLLWALR